MSATQQFRASPSRATPHYTHLTYAVRRKKEDETEDGKALSSKARPLVPAARDEKPPELPRLKPICGYAISEDGQLMSRFVSPPRFGPNSLLAQQQQQQQQLGGGGSSVVLPPASVLAPNTVASPQRVFTATVTSDGRGNPRISIPLQRARGTAAEAAEQQRQLEGLDAWTALVRCAAADGMTEDDVALLEWATVLKLLRHYAVPQAESSPVEKARCELTWRRLHDAAVFAAAATAAASPSSSLSSSAAQTPARAGDSYAERVRKAADEFRALVERLYPAPPIMQAAGGPVLLVRTAPQGEIEINAATSSPRRGDSAAAAAAAGRQQPIVHLRKMDRPGAVTEELDENGLVRLGSKPFGVRHVDPGPESSPLRRPVLK